MTDSKGPRWLTMSAEELSTTIGEVSSVEGDLPRMAAVVQIRAALAAEEASIASKQNAIAQGSTARWTKALAIVTALLVAATMWFSYRAMVFQEDTLRELRRQNCLAEADAEAGIAEGNLRPAEMLEAFAPQIRRCTEP